MRPERVAREAERPDAGRRQVLAPVTQEKELVRSGRRPVEDVDAEEREAVAENVAQQPRILAESRPHPDLGDRVASLEHATRLTAPV